jgi:GntR family transcriptional regulator
LSTGAVCKLSQIDPRSGTAIWLQVLRSIEAGISTRLYVEGDQLPSEHQLCEHFHVSRTSVREALAHLQKSGQITRRQGKGAFVEAPLSTESWTLLSAPSLLGQRRQDGHGVLTSQVIRAGIEALPPWVADVFRHDPSGQGFVIERLRAVEKLTAVHVTNYLPRRFVGLAPSLKDPHARLYAALERVCGVVVSRMYRTIEATGANRHVARLLEIEEGSPIVVVDAVAYDQNGDPVDFSRASVRTDRLRVTIDSGAWAPPANPDPGHWDGDHPIGGPPKALVSSYSNSR